MSAERTIDQEVYFVESLISVRDRGTWVADLDILGVDFKASTIADGSCERSCICDKASQVRAISDYDIRCIDSWDELLDPPSCTSIIRAHGNWSARLAITSVLFQRDLGHCVAVRASGSPCLDCLMKDRSIVSPGLRKYEANLPDYCVD